MASTQRSHICGAQRHQTKIVKMLFLGSASTHLNNTHRQTSSNPTQLHPFTTQLFEKHLTIKCGLNYSKVSTYVSLANSYYIPPSCTLRPILSSHSGQHPRRDKCKVGRDHPPKQNNSESTRYHLTAKRRAWALIFINLTSSRPKWKWRRYEETLKYKIYIYLLLPI